MVQVSTYVLLSQCQHILLISIGPSYRLFCVRSRHFVTYYTPNRPESLVPLFTAGLLIPRHRSYDGPTARPIHLVVRIVANC